MANILKRFIEFINFSFVGVTTFSIQLFVTIIISEMTPVPYYVAYALALMFAFSLNFMLNKGLTFRTDDHLKIRAERFAALIVMNAVLNWSLVIFTVEVIGLHYLPAMIAVTIFLSITNFIVEELWVFRRDR